MAHCQFSYMIYMILHVYGYFFQIHIRFVTRAQCQRLEHHNVFYLSIL